LLLIEELNHRVKNTLAIVQSIAAQSLRRAKDSDHFVDSFTGRVQALARAHDLLVKRRLSGSTLGELVSQQVALSGEDARIRATGPEVIVSGRDAIQLALVLHELATNARKYGALAPNQPTGQLSITWNVEFRPLPRLQLTWKETGVAGLTTPERRGFGSTLIERSLSGSGGSASVNFLAGGLECTLLLPLEDQRDLGMQAPTVQSPQRRAGRILVVEDEAMIAMAIEDTLTSTGFVVVGPAATLNAALELIGSAEIDAALLDANLNGVSVEPVAAALTRANIPFAFSTGHHREGLPASFGSARLLAKPFNDADLIATIAELLQPAAHPLRSKSTVSA
jgi:two-component sensor histidine kinase/CheY-like chemotaxis protein